VLRLSVPAEIDLALERPGAGPAGKRLEAGVFAAVRYEIGRLTEGLSTLTTHVWFFTCVLK